MHTLKDEFETAIKTLEGIMNGIAIDDTVDREELEELRNWCKYNYIHIQKQPYREIIPYIYEAIDDNYLDREEQKNIIQFCRNFHSQSDYFDLVSGEIQKLQGIIYGILANNEISTREAKQLYAWMEERDFLQGTYPFDELFSLLTSILEDGRIDEEEEKVLKVFFDRFIRRNRISTINFQEIDRLKREIRIEAVCATDPLIQFSGRSFAISGRSRQAKRSHICELIRSRGGRCQNRVDSSLDYLIAAENENSCWKYSCYGAKLSEALELRKEGKGPQIIHESDLWKAL